MNSRRPSVLIVDDSPEDTAVYKRYLARGSGQRYRVRQAGAGADAVAMLGRRAPDCVLLDFKLPDMDAIEALRAMATQSSQSGRLPCAVIVLTEVGEAQVSAMAEEVVKFGAQDCLEKSWITPELLRRAVANAIEKAALQREVEERRRELAAKDTTDITESERVEKALRESEEKFSKVFKASPHRITISTLDEGRYVDVNDAVLRATGYKREEMVGRTTEELRIFAEPEDRNKLLRAFRNRSVRDLEIQLRSKSGEIQTVLMSAEIITIGGRQCFLTMSNDITERKQAEEALRESEERFRTLANTAPSIIWMAKPDGTITFHNRQWLEYSDILPDEKGEWLRLALHPDDLERCLARWNRATELECEFEIELRLRRRGGEYRWFLTRATPRRGAKGRIANWFGVTTDIHQRKQIEEALHESEERLKLAMEAAGMFVWETDVVTGRVKSDFPEAMMGMEPGSFGGVFDSFLALVHPDDRESFLQVRKRALDGEGPYDLELRTVRPDGGVRWGLVRGVVHRDERGHPTRAIGVDIDITEHKRTEEALQRANRCYRIALDALDGYVYEYNVGDKVSARSKGLMKLIGFEPEEAEPHADWWFARVHPDDRQDVLSKTNEILADESTENTYSFEYRVRHKDGHYIDVLDRSMVARDAEGRPVQIVGAVINITERKRAEDVLRESAEHLRLAMEAANAGSFDWDIASGSVVWSPSHYRILGLEARDGRQPQKLWRDHVHPEDEWVVSDMVRALAERRDLNIEYRVVRADGAVRWVNSIGHTFYDDAGEPERMLGLMIDISEKKQAEEKLRESEERLRLALQGAQAGVWEVKFNPPSSYWSEEYRALYGFYLTDEATREIWADRVHPDDLQRVEAANEALLNSDCDEMRQEYRIIHPERGLRWILDFVRVRRDEFGRAISYGGINLDVTERRRAEEALRESEERTRQRNAELENIYQAAPIGLSLIDRHFRFIRINEALAEINGVSVGQTLGRTVREVTPEMAGRLEPILKQVIKTGQPIMNLDMRGVTARKPGVERDWLASYYPIKAADGNVQGIGSVVFDITERKRAEAVVRESEERLRLAAQAADFGLYSVDLRTGEGYWSPEMRRIFGLSEDDAVIMGDLLGFVHPDDHEEVMRVAEASLDPRGSDEFEIEFRSLRPDGGMRWVSARGKTLFTSRGRRRKAARVIGVVFDITGRKEAEERLHSSEELFRTIFDLSGIGILQVEPSTGRFLRANRKFCNWIGYTEAELLKMSFGDITHPGDRKIKLGGAEMFLRGEADEYGAEMRCVRKDGAVVWGMVTSRMLRDSEGRPLRTVTAVQDITKRKQAEMRIEELLRKEQEARAQAEAANRSKDEFLAMVSHELRSPLNAMLGWSRILKKGGVDEKTRTHAVEVIERSARAQQNLIEDLLDMARIAGGRLRLETRAINLARLVETAADVVRPAAAAKELELRLSIKSADEVTGDADRLQQVIWNLLSNSVKFTPHGGSVEVKLERIGAAAQITVTDTGRGIKAEDLPFIFDRFRQAESANTRRFAGLGLGLALVKHLVELHGGTVHADSPGEGQGASFIIKLPVRAIRGETAPGGARGRESRKAEERGSGRRRERENKRDVYHSPALSLSHSPTLPLKGVWVLIVDDEADARDLVATLLKQYGARVTDASCASEALDKLRKGADGARPDVIISDISMPDEDGYMLIERIRGLPPEEGGNIPAIALTAFERPSDRVKALASGFSMHVPKPVEPEELAMVIANLTAPPGKGTNVR